MFIEDNVIELMKENQFIPDSLIKYTEKILKKKSQDKYICALIDNPIRVINSIAAIIQEACKATQLSPDDLFHKSGFNKNDLDPTKIGSFLAELRIVNHLYSEGFNNIRFIKTSGLKSADLYAEKNSDRYVIEITNSSAYAKTGNWRRDDIVKFCLNKLTREKKYEQLKVTCQREACNKMVLAIVIDTEDKVALNSSKDYLMMAHDSWASFGELSNLHICIITGRVTLGYGKDDVVYPNWT